MASTGGPTQYQQMFLSNLARMRTTYNSHFHSALDALKSVWLRESHGNNGWKPLTLKAAGVQLTLHPSHHHVGDDAWRVRGIHHDTFFSCEVRNRSKLTSLVRCTRPPQRRTFGGRESVH